MTLKTSIYNDAKKTIGDLKRKLVIYETNLPNIDDRYNVVSFKVTNSSFVDLQNYVEDFLAAVEHRDFICSLFDGSLIQAYYKFDPSLTILEEGSLSFLPNPGFETGFERDLAEVAEPKEREELIKIALEINEKQKRSDNYLRIDYSSSDSMYKEIFHPKAHLHVGSNNDFRLCVNRFPFFSEFIDFILFSYYKDTWREIHLHGQVDDGVIDFSKYSQSRQEFIDVNGIFVDLTDNEKRHYLLMI